MIKDARRRQRRHRTVAAALILAAAVAVVLALGLDGGARVAPRLAAARAPTWLAGPQLGGTTGLRLVASENTGPASIVNVDSGRSRPVPGLGVPRRQRPASPALYPLVAAPGGALAVVTRQACADCAVVQTSFLITASGSARRTATVLLPRTGVTTAPALDSNAATWVLAQPHARRCSLRLLPSGRPTVPAPCGTLAGDTPAGLVVIRGSHVSIVDPRTGTVRRRLTVNGQFDVLSRDLALTSVSPDDPTEGPIDPRDLTLLNLATGARRALRWPSVAHFGYRVLPEPGGSLAAVEFADPGHYPGQLSDVWVLDTRTGVFTHVPGFPILEDLKFSDLAWTTDARLVVVAQGGGRTSIGVWRPGNRRLRVRRVPPLSGYSQLVSLVR